MIRIMNGTTLAGMATSRQFNYYNSAFHTMQYYNKECIILLGCLCTISMQIRLYVQYIYCEIRWVYMSHLCMANDVAYNHQSLFAIVDPVSYYVFVCVSLTAY